MRKSMARVLGEIAGADILPVAGEIGESECRLVDDAQEARRSAAVLDVRLPVLARGRQVERPEARDELGENGVDLRLPASILLETRIGAARPAALLNGLYRRREGDVCGGHVSASGPFHPPNAGSMPARPSRGGSPCVHGLSSTRLTPRSTPRAPGSGLRGCCPIRPRPASQRGRSASSSRTSSLRLSL